MKSMTGFGAGEYTDEELSVTIEIKTINHRYRDLDLRIPRIAASLEESIRKQVCECVTRGHVELTLRLKFAAKKASAVKYNPKAAEMYYSAISALKADYPCLTDNFGVYELSRAEDVISYEEEATDCEKLWQKISPALAQALEKLDLSRSAEGENLKGDFIHRVEKVGGYVASIAALSEAIPKAYYEELKKRVAEYTSSLISEERIATELAIYAEKLNITEELVRLASHMESFKTMIESAEPNGRKMDFLFQEINREANTIASKSNSFEISSLVVEIKSELEKMREQIQNIE